MRTDGLCLVLLSTIAISISASLPAQAQRARVFVSVSGDDANPCTAGSPCKTFQHAHNVVQAGGEISVLDTGGYGTLRINKAISIVAVGVQASIAIPSVSDGIVINAGSTDDVSLRGLTLDGTGVGGVGIRFTNGQSLTVQDCVVRNMASTGLQFDSNATTLQTLAVSNSHFYDNGSSGIRVGTSGSGPVLASIDRTGLFGNAIAGLDVNGSSGTGTLTVAVTDSVAANNNESGFRVASSNNSVSSLSLTRSQALSNGTGVEAQGIHATLSLAQSMVTGNGSGFATGSGVIETYGDNYLQAANGPNHGTLTPATKQ